MPIFDTGTANFMQTPSSRASISDLSEIETQATRRVALRILPFVFILYVVNYIDRVSISYANLRMSVDLGFSDRVYGLGVSIFYLSYLLFEIPLAILVARWSARKWITRIMLSWGLVTMLTAFVQTAAQFYVARFLLGLAESSFFPCMILYLTHWFRQKERSRAIACLYTAIPTAMLIGSPIAGQLLGVNWFHFSGWRWLLVLEGVPAIILGGITYFYLTDRPSHAKWLLPEERSWLIREIQGEQNAKKKERVFSIREAFTDHRVLLLILTYFLALSGVLANLYWIPTFTKRISGFDNQLVTILLMVPAIIGICGTLINGWHSDKTLERCKHTAIPLIITAAIYVVASFSRNNLLSVLLLLVGSGTVYAFYPTFWSIPTMILTESAASATFGLINCIGQLGGFFGNFMVGYLNDRTHNLMASLAFIAVMYLLSGGLMLLFRLRYPVRDSAFDNHILTANYNG